MECINSIVSASLPLPETMQRVTVYLLTKIIISSNFFKTLDKLLHSWCVWSNFLERLIDSISGSM